MPTPYEAAQLLRDEASIDARKFRYAREHDELRETQILRRSIKGGLEKALNPASNLLPTVMSLSPHEKKNYSVSKLVADMMKGGTEATLEREVSWSIQKDLGVGAEHGGHFIPYRMSGQDGKTNEAGGFLIERKTLEIIDSLVNQSKCLSLGAGFLSGLKWAQQFPLELAPPDASWVSENSGSDVSDSNATFGMITASPKTLQSSTTISRQLLQQGIPSLENWLRARLARGHALMLDAACLNGPGSESKPLGLLRSPNIGDYALGQNGLVPTAASILALEGKVAAANADSSSCAFLTTPGIRTILRGLPSITSGTEPLWDENTMLGYVAEVSNQCPSTLSKGTSSGVCHAIIFADWSRMLITEFTGALELTTDPYAAKKRGLVELATYGSYDVILTAPGAFAACQDAKTS